MRNPNYWRKDAAGRALPYLDRLTLEITPDQNAELLRLQSGQADLTQSEMRPDDYAALKREAAAGKLRLVDAGLGVRRRRVLVQPASRARRRTTAGRGSRAWSCAAPCRTR